MSHTQSGTVQLRKLVIVLTIWDRSAPGAGFVITIQDHEAPEAGLSNVRDLCCTLGPFSSGSWFCLNDPGS